MKLDLQPHLQGNLLKLRPLLSSDFEELYTAASDPLIWEQHPDSNRYQIDIFKKFFSGALESRGALVAIELKSKKIIGTSRYYDYNPEKNEVAIGYTFLVRAVWGGTVNGEMKKLMLEHAFRFVKSVIFHIGENNWRSRKAVEKIGGVFENSFLHTNEDGSKRLSTVYRIWAK